MYGLKTVWKKGQKNSRPAIKQIGMYIGFYFAAWEDFIIISILLN